MSVKVPFSFLTEQFSNPEPIFQGIREFLKRCDFTLGEDLQEFEKRYANYCGAKFAIGVGTGTDAIALALKANGIGYGDEVITAPNSFVATTGAIVQVGATPVYIDIAPDLNIDVERIESVITSKTKAIVPVHWAGGPVQMDKVMEIANRHGLVVVEDACQALGAKYKGKSVGTYGAAGAFSTHPLKPLHVWGDGGMIVTNSEKLAADLRLIRNHGLAGRDEVAVWGVNSRFDNLHAIVGNYVMNSLDDTIDRRIRHATRFDKAFSDVNFAKVVRVPQRLSEGKHVFHLYQIHAENRDGLLKHLTAQGIEAKIHYPTPLHLQPAAKSFGYMKGSFPATERQSADMVTLPCHQYLSDEQIEYTIKTVADFYKI